MFFTALILFLMILPVTFLSLALEDFFSPAELDEMGVCYPCQDAA
jgi:hypothetical protein